VTENERRAADVLSVRDLVLRGVSAIGLIMFAVIMLLAMRPI
jgi:hypothetical protein